METMVEPVRTDVLVEVDQAEAFRIYTERIADWWPVHTHSMSHDRLGEPARGCGIEPFVGGRCFEVMADGSECAWGEIRVWEPPHRLVHSWDVSVNAPGPTEVEIRFEPAEGGTRVSVEHRGWEIWGEEADEKRSSYNRGWPTVLGLYAEAT